ncbi:penicillin acylase family protein [Octadecabacter sp. 1_MG-2023]|uniref:penicillin acylase family protein n=1 Tax=unclassified Octadecabacter TaxID=196158 RepID=UPI001C0973D5|nr:MULTISPECIES: penicillin acylase family protein [unclassified Octadecabacter]MBU2993302.1 penicillin acylase family protein [Octadecabacter sp. B2R22]MDO6733242.1 penicillin acylase family protein [Octadecabacter sp. 1_MG-2023]
MALIFRWLIRLASALIVLAVATFALAYYFASRSLPDYDGTVEVAGISAPVEIVRDNANVPHIFGETDEDVFFALGMAHAQDRLWQMTMLRRTAQGRLSELFGERTLPIDSLIRRLDLYPLSQSSVQALDDETQAALRAYSDGVNAWINQVNAGARGRGAPEMWMFNHAIAPWQPADSVSIIKLMAVQLSSHLEEEVLRARASLLLNDDERLNDILPLTPGSGLAALPNYASLMPDVPSFTPNTRMAFDPLSPVVPRSLAGASNAWAAGVNRSATGSTLLANDPHLGLTAPSIWYLARLELSEGGVIGGTIPGVPVVMLGRSSNLGWGITSSYLDDQDIYIEEVNPSDASQYRTPEGWASFETRDSIIRIKDAPSVTLQLQWTVNGPVLPPSQYDLASIRPAGHVTALGWTALSGEDTTIQAAMALMRARNVEAGIAAAEDYVAPSQMLTLADRNSVGLKLIGHVPNRSPDHVTQGRLPHYGYLLQNRWNGRRPYDTNPEWIDPTGGIVGNTNNKVVEEPFPAHVSFMWGDSQRINRWRLLMQAREVHTRDSFIEAQLDTVSYTARSILPLIGADLWFTGEAAPDGTPERLRQDALALLGEWNGEMNEHLPEPLLYSAWMRALQDRLIRDELGPLSREFTHVEPLFIERVFRNTDGAAVWCDVLQSAPTETCSDIARIALDDALIWVSENHSDALESLRWGDAHEATHDHAVLGEAPVLHWFVNIRQSTSGGDNTLMRGRTSGEGEYPFQNVHAAAYRGVYDFADPDSSVFITSTGQSGHFLSRHYDDLGDLWRRGEFIPMSLDPALARGGAVGITVLRPAQ